ncbi:hypothetical protein GCM10009818_03760 [Nakamurella flavida]
MTVGDSFLSVIRRGQRFPSPVRATRRNPMRTVLVPVLIGAGLLLAPAVASAEPTAYPAPAVSGSAGSTTTGTPAASGTSGTSTVADASLASTGAGNLGAVALGGVLVLGAGAALTVGSRLARTRG